MVMNKIPEDHDLRKILEVLLDKISRNTVIDNSEVRMIIEAGNPKRIQD